MTIKEYIKEYCPIKNRVMQMIKDPVTRVMERDDLPYDDIRIVDGVLQKVVYLDDEDDYMSVLDLLSYDRADILAMKDCPLKATWLAYAENIEVSTLFDLRALSREYLANKRKKEELANKCTL